MMPITATTYFTNNVMIRRQITLARAIALMHHAAAIIPPEADILEVHGAGWVLLVPDQLIFNINRAYIPRPPLASRRGVWLRDRGRCAYCGHEVPLTDATLDHIVPASVGGPTTWENLVNACRRCNEKKANRTPEQAHMPLLFEPYAPRMRLRPDPVF